MTGLVAAIVENAASIYRIPPELITSNDRFKATTNARAVVCYAARKRGMTYSAIGRALGKDHTTVISACARVTNDEELRRIGDRLAETHGDPSQDAPPPMPKPAHDIEARELYAACIDCGHPKQPPTKSPRCLSCAAYVRANKAAATGFPDDDPRHGTHAGYKAHARHGTRPCDPCLNARTEYALNRKQRKKDPVLCENCSIRLTRSKHCRSCAAYLSNYKMAAKEARESGQPTPEQRVHQWTEQELDPVTEWVRDGLIWRRAG